jgi:hypothetical protein
LLSFGFIYDTFISAAPNAVVVFAIIVLHTFVFGYSAVKLLRFKSANLIEQFAILMGLGIVILGWEMWFLGYINGWNPSSLYASTGLVGVAGAIYSFRFFKSDWKQFAKDLRLPHALPTYQKILLISCVAMTVAIFISGLRAPFLGDELDYHWAGPVFWAHTGHWTATPFRLTNGPCLTELLYLIGAILQSSAAAHWTHSLFFLILVAACAGLAQRGGGNAIVAAAACFSCPVMVNQSSVCYSDISAASLMACACLALLTTPYKDQEWEPSIRTILVASILLAGSASIKPLLCFFALIGLGAYLAFKTWTGTTDKNKRLQKVVVRLMALGLPVLGVFLLWTLHTHSLTGKFADTSNVIFVKSPDDIFWKTGGAVGRIPSILDVLYLPIAPFTTWLIGQQEPYGGRTALVMMPGVLALWFLRKRLTKEQLSICKAVAFSASCYYFLLGPFMVKTRYQMYVWTLLLSLAACGFKLWYEDAKDVYKPVLSSIYCILILIGMADCLHVIARFPG